MIIASDSDSGLDVLLRECFDVAICEIDFDLTNCDPWTARAICQYAHESAGVPYSSADEKSFCTIFADGFESGDTTNWTLSVP